MNSFSTRVALANFNFKKYSSFSPTQIAMPGARPCLFSFDFKVSTFDQDKF